MLSFNCSCYLCITFVDPNDITRIVLQVPLEIGLGYFTKLKFIIQVLRQIQNVEKLRHFVNPLKRYSNGHLG